MAEATRSIDDPVVRSIAESIKEGLKHHTGSEYGTLLKEMLSADLREQLKKLTAGFLDEIASKKGINSYEIFGMRRETFKDVYPQRVDREVALRVFWRARKTKEKLFWCEGEHLTREQDAEFGHLLEMDLWGMNGDLTGNVRLRKPSHFLMDMRITPIMPVQYISLNLEIKDGQV